jgi:hypothetical protein
MTIESICIRRHDKAAAIITDRDMQGVSCIAKREISMTCLGVVANIFGLLLTMLILFHPLAHFPNTPYTSTITSLTQRQA